MSLKPIPGSLHVTSEHLNTLRKEAHDALNDIINNMETRGVKGGESIIHTVDPPIQQNRLTFCDFTGQSLCAFCSGTGLARNFQNDN